eukprot:364774-Chlamydomonas_euryale.AAC.3
MRSDTWAGCGRHEGAGAFPILISRGSQGGRVHKEDVWTACCRACARMGQRAGRPAWTACCRVCARMRQS